MKYTVKIIMKSNNRCVDSSVVDFSDDDYPSLVIKMLQINGEYGIDYACERFQKEKSDFYATVTMNGKYLCEFTYS